MTLDNIRDHMLNYMSQDFPDDGEPYDEDGHCGNGMWNEVKRFWKNFKTEEDLLWVVSGRYISDDIDLDGGRSYILSSSGVIPLLFDYLYNNMGYTLNDYQEIIFNTLDITDEIEELYDSPDVIRDTKIDRVLEQPLENKNSHIVVKYPSHMKDICDSNPNLQFIGKSKINDDPVYRVSIPQGYEIVPPISDLI